MSKNSRTGRPVFTIDPEIAAFRRKLEQRLRRASLAQLVAQTLERPGRKIRGGPIPYGGRLRTSRSNGPGGLSAKAVTDP